LSERKIGSQIRKGKAMLQNRLYGSNRIKADEGHQGTFMPSAPKAERFSAAYLYRNGSGGYLEPGGVILELE